LSTYVHMIHSRFDLSFSSFQWLRTYIMPWLSEIYCFKESSECPESGIQQNKRQMFEFQKQRLQYHLHEIYANFLIDRLFAVIVDFPDSEPVVKDLKICLDHVDLRRKLALNLRSSLEKRLLHPGNIQSIVFKCTYLYLL